ncbi:phosphate transport system permease protein [Armatimonadetes bacterium GBS]|jgi:phosphate transport system permease protein|nr:phosphate transport system permease protein [Armatimonadetes bacterium GBS]
MMNAVQSGSVRTVEWESLAARQDARRARKNALLTSAFGAVGLATVLLVLGLVAAIAYHGAPTLSWEFLTQPPREGMSAGGVGPMILGSILLMVGAFLMATPLGVFGGVCLAEYGERSRLMRLMHASVAALAGTPPIVYGLFGLAIFVLKFKLGVSLLAGWLTLTLFCVPSIVLTTEAALKTVPAALIDGGLALGLSRWQTLWRIALPYALPGILTGIILSLGRAVGEATPVLFTASIYYTTAETTLGWETLRQPVANLPYYLAEGYRQPGVVPERLIWGACLTLILLTLLLNAGAILIRSRTRRRYL